MLTKIEKNYDNIKCGDGTVANKNEIWTQLIFINKKEI